MLTKSLIDKFYKDVSILGLKFPVARIAEVTGESKGNVSRILSKKMEPGEVFMKKFYEGFKIPEFQPPDSVCEDSADAHNTDQSTFAVLNALLEEKEARRRETAERAEKAERIILEKEEAIKSFRDALAERKRIDNIEFTVNVLKENVVDWQYRIQAVQELLIRQVSKITGSSMELLSASVGTIEEEIRRADKNDIRKH